MRKLAWIAAASAVLVLTGVLGVSLLDGHHSAFADTGNVNFDIDPLIAEDEDTDGKVNDGCPAFNAGGSEDDCGSNTCADGIDNGPACDGAGSDGADQNDADECIGSGAETAATQCTDTIDNDMDGYVNDGCAAVGAAETACGNSKNVLGEVQGCVRVNGTTAFDKVRDYQIDAVVSGNTTQLFSYDAWVTYDNTRVNVLDVGGVPKSNSTIKNPGATNACTDEWPTTDARMSSDGRADCGSYYTAYPGTGWAGDGTILRLSLDIDFTNPGVVTFAFDKGAYRDLEGHLHDSTTGSGKLAINTDCPSANTPPVAADKTVTTNEDTPANVTLTATDAETCDLTFSITTPPQHGSLGTITDQACASGSPNSDSALVAYTPASNYSGPDSFDYQVSDGSLTDTATVTITVTPVNDAPNVTAPTTMTVAEDSAATAPTTIADVDDTTFTCALVSGSEPAHGSVTFAANCASVTYTATQLNYNGSDSFTFRVTDSGGGQGSAFKLSDDQPVSVTVTPVNDAPNVTAPTTITTAEDSAATAPTTITDVDDTAFTCALVSGSEPAHGSVTFAANCASVTYTPNSNYYGSDAFTFRVTDSGGGQGSAFKLSDDQPVSVTVTPVSDPPVANDVSGGNVPKDSTNNPWTPSVSDPDGGTLTCSILTQPTSGGTATVASDCSSGTYTPAAGFTGSDSFVYQVSDGSFTDTATVSITVTGAPPEKLTIDIRPGSYPNTINLKSKDVISVAILTSATFDATTVDPSSVCFGDAEDPSQRDCTEAHGRGHIQDVDKDGDLDLVLHYEAGQTGIDLGDTQACLTGRTFDGMAIRGCDSIKVLPAKGASGMDGGMFALGAPLGLLGIRLGRNALEKTRRRF